MQIHISSFATDRRICGIMGTSQTRGKGNNSGRKKTPIDVAKHPAF
jgi:hypothetical protein